MAVPVLPIFDDDDDPGNTTPFGISAGRIIVLIVAVRLARYIKQKFWSDDLNALRRLWSNSPQEICTASILAGLCVIINVVMAACAGIRLMSIGQKYPLQQLCSTSSLWVLSVFFAISQMMAAVIKIPPGDYNGIYALLRVVPASSVKFALHLDFLATLCVFPVFVFLSYCGVRDAASLSPVKIATAFLISSMCVMAPSLQAEEDEEHKNPLSISARRQFIGSDDKIDPDLPVSSQILPKKTIVIKSKGCSPTLLLRIQQLEAQQEEIEQKLEARKHKQV